MTVAVEAPFAPGVTEEGEIAQVAAAGTPEQDSDTACVNPEIDVMSTVKLVDFPATTVAADACVAMLKSGVKPVPLSSTTCGLPGTLSVIDSAPSDAFDVVGV